MNKLFKIVITGLCLLFGSFIKGNAQNIIGVCSDTVYLLSVFHNSGEKEKHIDLMKKARKDLWRTFPSVFFHSKVGALTKTSKRPKVF